RGGTRAPRVSVRKKGGPLAQMRRVGEGLPHSRRRVAQFSDENERPLLPILGYLRPARRTRRVLLAIGHILFLAFLFPGGDWPMRSRWRSSASTCADQNRRNGASQTSTS